MIIRFNGATTFMPFSDDVGRKTTIQLSTLVPWRHWRRRVDAQKLDRERDNVLYCHNSWVGNCWLDASHFDRRKVINPVLVRLAGALLRAHTTSASAAGSVSSRSRRHRTSRVPSTGLVGVALALASCDGVPDVYGFGNRSGGGGAVCDHYWECRTDQGSYLGRPTHSFQAQSRTLGWLRDVGAIRLLADVPGERAFTLLPGQRRVNV